MDRPKIDIKNTYSDKELTKNEFVKLQQTISQLFKESHKDFDKCLICGKDMKKPCDSHSLPKFILKQVASNGLIRCGNYFMWTKDHEKGVNNALLFRDICEECDSAFFQEYENPTYIEEKFSITAINEIAAKNLLRAIYKRTQERELFCNQYKKHHGPALANKILICDLDINSAKATLSKIIKHKQEKHYYIIDEFSLPYQTLLAFQGFVALTKGFDGLINNIYNFDPRYRIEELGICVFPYKGKTKIVLFCLDSCTRMKLFYKKYRMLNLDEKLYVINYIILLYTEEWVVPASFNEKQLNKETLLLINQTTDVYGMMSSLLMTEEEIHKEELKQLDLKFSLQTSGNIYNFLK